MKAMLHSAILFLASALMVFSLWLLREKRQQGARLALLLKREHAAILLLFLAMPVAHAQGIGGGPGVGTASRLRKGTLPATCSPGDVWFDTAGNVQNNCNTTNVWTPLGSGAGTVTNTSGALTANAIVLGNGGADTKVGNLSGDVTTSGSAVTTVVATHLAVALPAAQGGTGSTTIPTAGQIAIGNAGGTAYAPVTASGSCTVTSAGVFTCAGGGGVIYPAFTVPVAANFSTHTNFASATLTQESDRMVFDAPDTNGAHFAGAFKTLAFATPYTLEALMTCNYAAGNVNAKSVEAGIALRESTIAAGTWHQVSVLDYTTGSLTNSTSLRQLTRTIEGDAGVGNFTHSSAFGNSIWYRITNSGIGVAAVGFWVSATGKSWQLLTTEASIGTEDTWGFTISTANGQSIDTICDIEHVREYNTVQLQFTP